MLHLRAPSFHDPAHTIAIGLHVSSLLSLFTASAHCPFPVGMWTFPCSLLRHATLSFPLVPHLLLGIPIPRVHWEGWKPFSVQWYYIYILFHKLLCLKDLEAYLLQTEVFSHYPFDLICIHWLTTIVSVKIELYQGEMCLTIKGIDLETVASKLLPRL